MQRIQVVDKEKENKYDLRGKRESDEVVISVMSNELGLFSVLYLGLHSYLFIYF